MTTEVDLVRAHWHLRGHDAEMTPSTVARYERVFGSFVRFAAASKCDSLAAVTSPVCLAFVHAPCGGGHQPARSTSRFRLTVIRDGLRALQRAGIASSDPTAGIRVQQSVQARQPEPLTPSEATRLRLVGRVFPRDHMRPATVELALAGGSHAEIAATVIADLDLRRDRICLGSRWAELDPFAKVTLMARVAACRRASRRARDPWDPEVRALALSKPLSAYPPTSVGNARK
jgi:site-specific recombinase XerC